jgi:hypothetical protein
MPDNLPDLPDNPRRNRGRSRGGTGLGTLPLRPLPSAGDRGRLVLDGVVVDGELVGPPPPLARPAGTPFRGEQVFADDLAPRLTLQVHHLHEQPQQRRGGAFYAALYALCGFAAVVFVVFALSIAGKLNGTPTPWKQDAIQQQHQRSAR